MSGKKDKIMAINRSVVPINPRFSINHDETNNPTIPPEPSGRSLRPIWIENSVDDEKSKTKKDEILNIITNLLLTSTALLITAMPAERNNKGR